MGDSVGFEVGRRLGPWLMAAKPLVRHADRLDDARDLLARRGGWAVVLGRWVAFFRAVMPALAGSTDMRYRTFLVFNALGGVLWATAVVMGGYLAGTSYQAVADALGTGGCRARRSRRRAGSCLAGAPAAREADERTRRAGGCRGRAGRCHRRDRRRATSTD